VCAGHDRQATVPEWGYFFNMWKTDSLYTLKQTAVANNSLKLSHNFFEKIKNKIKISFETNGYFCPLMLIFMFNE